MDLQNPPVSQNGSLQYQLSPQKIREAKYEVLLFFVELLMEHKSRKLHDLSCLFGSPNFSPQMKQICAGSQTGLKRFLLKYPSLFTIKGDTVTMTCYDFEDLFRNGLEAQNSTNGVKENTRIPSVEEEAVEFFRSKLLAAPVKDECRLPLRSLIGHRSQAPEKIRAAMGRTLPDFIRFIRAHGDTFLYDGVHETIQLTGTAQKSPRDCLSPNSSSSSQSASLASGEFNIDECLEFLASVLQQKGPLFLDELYGHLNKKYKPDVRQHFAKNPRELGELIQQKSNNRFRVEGNLVSYVGQTSPQESPRGNSSPPGSAREGMKLKLAQTLNKVMIDNKARGALPEPDFDKHWIIPWNEVTKPKQLKSLVAEILDSSAGTEAVGLEFVFEDIDSPVDSAAHESRGLPFQLSAIFMGTFDGKVHLISILEHPELVRLGGLRELLESDKIRKVFHDGSKGVAMLLNQYKMRVVNPFDTQIGFSILEYQSTIQEEPDAFLATNRSLSIMDVANGCSPSTARALHVPNKLDLRQTRLFEGYRNLRLIFPHVYEALKNRIPVKFTPLHRTLLEEEYETYLNVERSKLLRKNRLTLHQHEMKAHDESSSSRYAQNQPADDTEVDDPDAHTKLVENSHDNFWTKKCATCEVSCQTNITGEVTGLIYSDDLFKSDNPSNS